MLSPTNTTRSAQTIPAAHTATIMSSFFMDANSLLHVGREAQPMRDSILHLCGGVLYKIVKLL